MKKIETQKFAEDGSDEKEIRDFFEEDEVRVDVVRSKEILQKGLEKLQIMLDSRHKSGELLGAWDTTVHQGGYRSWSVTRLEPDNSDSKRAVLERLAFGGAKPVFDNQVLVVANDSGDGSCEIFSIDDEELCQYSVSRNRTPYSNEAYYSIFGEAVTMEDYGEFAKKLKNIQWQDPQIENELLVDDKQVIKVMKMDKILDKATVVGAGFITLKNIYGGQHFGSGGGYGLVRAYKLSDWRKGIKTSIEPETKGAKDNNFMSGPDMINIQPDMFIVAEGGDTIGKGRSWHEYYYCEAEGTVTV